MASNHNFKVIMLQRVLIALLVIVGLNVPVQCAISKEQLVAHARFDLYPDEADYIDEVINGHYVKDLGKFKRQEGCLCVSHFRDPHCGSDMNTYDNGCYFMCAQQRSPGLRLKRWGKCKDQDTMEARQAPYKDESDLLEVDADPYPYN